MSHTLFREGSVESLHDDIALVVRPERGINSAGSAEKVQHILDLLQKHHANNFGGGYHKNIYVNPYVSMREEYTKDGESLCGVFSSYDDACAFLADLVACDFGISVVFSGLYNDIDCMCKKNGLTPHTTNHSLGIWGKTETLPPPEYRAISTMCGHGMIPFSLIQSVVADIKKGRLTLEKGAEKLALPCTCGILNTKRAEKLLAAIIAKDAAESTKE